MARMARQRKLVLTCAVAALIALPVLSACSGSTARSVLSSHSLPTSVNVPTPTHTSPPQQTVTSTHVETRTQTQTHTVQVTPPAPAADDQSDDNGVPWWLWLVIALVLVIVGVSIYALRGRRRDAAWDERLRGARDHAAWIEGSLVPQLQGKATAAEVAAMWDAAQPQLLQFDQELHTLVGEAPDDERRTRAAVLRQRVAELVQAQSAEASVTGAQTADQLRSLQAAVGRARAAVREVLPTTPR
jgi:hypothetical protein